MKSKLCLALHNRYIHIYLIICLSKIEKLKPYVLHFRVFDEAISCQDTDLDRLMQLIIANNIKIEGQCNQPEHLSGSSLADAIQNKMKKTEHIRNKRSGFTDPSVYNFAGEMDNKITYDTILLSPYQIIGK